MVMGSGWPGFTPVHAAGDADLVRQARDGDEVAFADLYRRYARMVHGLLLACVPFDKVDDLVQQVRIHPRIPVGALIHRGLRL